MLKYAPSQKVYDCASLRLVASNAGGADDSTNQCLGIGMNYPNVGQLILSSQGTTHPWVKESTVRHPVDTIEYGDTGAQPDSFPHGSQCR